MKQCWLDFIFFLQHSRGCHLIGILDLIMFTCITKPLRVFVPCSVALNAVFTDRAHSHWPVATQAEYWSRVAYRKILQTFYRVMATAAFCCIRTRPTSITSVTSNLPCWRLGQCCHKSLLDYTHTKLLTRISKYCAEIPMRWRHRSCHWKEHTVLGSAKGMKFYTEKWHSGI